MTGFATAVDRLINQVAHWEQARWWTRPGRSAGPGPSPAPRRSDSGPVAGRSDSGPVAGRSDSGPVAGPSDSGPVAGRSDSGPVAGPSDPGPVMGPSDSGPVAGTAVPPTRADLVYALVQRIADRGADAEGRPRRTVPRLADLVLPDQVRVVADDLIAAVPAEDVLVAAAADVEAVRRTI